MSFVDAILEKQRLELENDPTPFEVILRRNILIDGETAVFSIHDIVSSETCHMYTEIMQASRPTLVGKKVEMNNQAPFLNSADRYWLNKFNNGGLITLKYTKRRTGPHIFIFDYRD